MLNQMSDGTSLLDAQMALGQHALASAQMPQLTMPGAPQLVVPSGLGLSSAPQMAAAQLAAATSAMLPMQMPFLVSNGALPPPPQTCCLEAFAAAVPAADHHPNFGSAPSAATHRCGQLSSAIFKHNAANAAAPNDSQPRPCAGALSPPAPPCALVTASLHPPFLPPSPVPPPFLSAHLPFNRP